MKVGPKLATKPVCSERIVSNPWWSSCVRIIDVYHVDPDFTI